ncbi:hypothetical protein B0J13DRAFT_566420 [Dactylonectria estremocensis]|uniref:F-box domain-containing protein n=1 Tax=Dactylonectria estremocensis TaxID=1079267 RepID=A0A9P9DQR7_9HYPO|nr:hypothetical protein B0J13DRAFT_566420 [Dactylonectria estremocensis]
MGSWDCYCAICGGPLVRARIRGHGSDSGSASDSSHASSDGGFEAGSDRVTDQGSDVGTTNSIRGNGRDEDSDVDSYSDDLDAQEGSQGEAEDDGLSMSDDREEDNFSDGSKDEKTSNGEEGQGEGYDPDILQPRDIEWTETCHVLGFNAEVSGVSKAFVSGPCRYNKYGSVNCEPGTDPNAQGVDQGLGIAELRCYSAPGEIPVFPFHWECYKLLAQALTGSSNTGGIDKDVLYGVMRSKTGRSDNMLGICYDEPGTAKDAQLEVGRAWRSHPGQEFLVCSPSPEPQLSRQVRSDLRHDFALPIVDSTLGSKVETDFFVHLPPDLTDQVLLLLDHRALISLLNASWSLHFQLHSNGNFWKERIQKEMPWFFELQEFLRAKNSTSTKNMKGLYLWAEQVTIPRKGLTWPYMAIANRRRIWGVCQQISDLYMPKLHKSHLGVQPAIHDQASCSYIPIVSSPFSNEQDPSNDLVCAYWVYSWDEMYTEKTVETFWDDDGCLVGISVAPKGQRRLFGVDDSQDGVQIRSFDLDSSAWVTEIILHIPQMNILIHACGQCCHQEQGGIKERTTSPRGITICTSNQQTVHLGTRDPTYCHMPFLPVGGRVIVGLMGQTGFIKKKPRILRFGLILAPWPPADDPRMQLPVPQPPMLQKCLWKGESCWQMGRQIWAWDKLTMRTLDGQPMDQELSFHADVIPCDVLMWAHSTDQLKAVRAITAFFIETGTLSSYKQDEPIRGICNMRVDFDPALNLEPRFARSSDVDGRPSPEDDLRTFDIDGPGGERIVEVAVADLHSVWYQAFRVSISDILITL